MRAMRRWELEAALQQVEGFRQSDAALEQYATSAEIATCTVGAMRDEGDVDGQLVADFGCGTGRLSVAAALHGAAFVLAVDVDEDALELARANTDELHDCPIDFVRADVAAADFLRAGALDGVVMNPPFGTKRAGVDMAFLARAARAARTAVYSMHKTSTRDYIERRVVSWGATAEVIAQVQFDIGKTLRFHRARSVDVEVDVWRVDVRAVRADDVDRAAVQVGELMDGRDIGRNQCGYRHGGGKGSSVDRSRGEGGRGRGRGRGGRGRGGVRGRGRGTGR